MEELHTDSIDGGHEGQLWARSRARERAYSNTPNDKSEEAAETRDYQTRHRIFRETLIEACWSYRFGKPYCAFCHQS
jgi:hypothetical protein